MRRLAVMIFVVAVLAGCSKPAGTGGDSLQEKEYEIAVAANDGGTAKATIGDKDAAKSVAGVVVTLTAAADEKYKFVQWTSSDDNVIFADPAATSTRFIMPAVNVSIGAEFEILPRVTINGVLWATKNVGLPGSFSANAEDPGLLYQWNRRTGWSAANPLQAYDEKGEIPDTWSSSSYTAVEWTPGNNPCPEGWRVASKEDFDKLGDDTKVTRRWVAASGTTAAGMQFTDNATGASMFLPAAGYRGVTGSLAGEGSGRYWSSTPKNPLDPSYSTTAYVAIVGSSGFYSDIDYAYANGYSVRCVSAE